MIKVLSTGSEIARKGKSCIINFFGCFEDNESSSFYYLVFEKAEMNLKSFLAHENDLKKEIKEKDLLSDIAEGVFHIHENKIIHLDLKLENILLVRRDNVLQACICDFGTSRGISEDGTVPFTKEMLGTEVTSNYLQNLFLEIYHFRFIFPLRLKRLKQLAIQIPSHLRVTFTN